MQPPWLLSLHPPRHSEGQEAQSWLGQYSLALACTKRGAKGPLGCNSTSVFRCSALHCLALTPQLPRSCPSLRCGWVGLGKQTGLPRPNDAALCEAAIDEQAQLRTPMTNADVNVSLGYPT